MLEIKYSFFFNAFFGHLYLWRQHQRFSSSVVTWSPAGTCWPYFPHDWIQSNTQSASKWKTHRLVCCHRNNWAFIYLFFFSLYLKAKSIWNSRFAAAGGAAASGKPVGLQPAGLPAAGGSGSETGDLWPLPPALRPPVQQQLDPANPGCSLQCIVHPVITGKTHSGLFNV